jgi:hypothetical protein
MTPARRDGRFLLVLGAAMFLVLGAAMARKSPDLSDFRLVYNGNRCLLQNVDPYRESGFRSVYIADAGPPSAGLQQHGFQEMMHYIQSPATSILAPFALLNFGLANLLWLALIAASFLLAASLVWDMGAACAPILSGGLVGVLLAGSGSLLVHANPAGLVVSLCVIAVWCFVRERFVLAGILCLATGLLLKPHDAALVWLYFLLAGGVYRKRALQTLSAAIVLALPLLLWVTGVAPRWISELSANLATLAAHGHANDPGPASMSVHGIGMIVSLQSVLSFLRDDPAFYKPVSYLICGILLFLWSHSTFRSRPMPRQTWLALASIAALSMLPFYHRLYDTRLLLLTVPACAILRSEGGRLGRFALAITAATLLFTSDLFWNFLANFLNRLPQDSHSGLLLTAIQVLPVPLLLLLTAAFYLYACLRPTPQATSS